MNTNSRILLCLAHMSGNELKYIEEAFADNWVAPLGPNVDGFEDDLQRFYGSNKRVVALSAGTAAIHLGLIMLGVKAGDEVICQSFTFSASANPIIYQGATPIFVDSEPLTWNMSPELLEEAILDRKRITGKYPKAIIVVHLYGMPVQMKQICAIAKKYNIPILEDAAEAMGSMYKGKHCGTFGKYGAISFNGNKMITTSGGGALIVTDDKTKEKVKFLATQAREPFPYYQHKEIGYNYRMSNICAGIGRGQMTIVDSHISHHRKVHQLYDELLADIPGIRLHRNPNSDFDSNYWLCNITIDAQIIGINYEEMRQELEKHNIESRPLWKPMHMQPVFQKYPSYLSGVSERLFNCGLCLPAGPWVTPEDVMKIVDVIKRAITDKK